MDTPYSFVLLEETASTQDDARQAYVDRPVLVVAGRQTRGRGRSGAGWVTAPRAMAASLAFDPEWPGERMPLVALVAGLAAARVLDCELKWPNDVMRGDRKLGGILVEATGGLVVAGLGLNLWWPDAPPGAAALETADPGPERSPVIARAWAAELLNLLERGWRAWPRAEYQARCVTVGQDITWRREGGSGRGAAREIADDGSLVVEGPDGLIRLRSGEVTHVRPDRE